MTTAKVQLYILSRDRPAYLQETLRSAIGEMNDDVQVIVSDNSEGDEVERMVAEEFPLVTYLRRRPALPALDHFHVVIAESSAEFVVYFHDDDLMLPGFVATLRDALVARPELSAVACNANLVMGDKVTSRRVMGDCTEPHEIASVEALVTPYLTLTGPRPAPFPGYMYRRKCLDGLSLKPEEGGKHADLAFLISVLRRAPMLWLPKPNMLYRVHASNDSRVESIGQRLRLLRHVYRQSNITPRSSAVAEYRFVYWLNWWRAERQRPACERAWCYRTVSQYLLFMGCRLGLKHPSLSRKLLTRSR
ncbi:glycosyltransferase family A protein [Pandoraea terrigena]|uniref:Putative glycosyltransferase O-antigen related protein n=1 Tax=Pandoraea terrigena TaxID=2508292 RepID=A0A5E4VTE5_9BURK|nr:glycosyltransferase family A protein [Pandoraea terrigena]VVE14809.1 putative glycosyltransferase O-antigen related protein [Pandoraea terrigena]